MVWLWYCLFQDGLKVSKFQKQIDLFSFEPKTERNISALRIDKYFVRFLVQMRTGQFAFEIYWPLPVKILMRSIISTDFIIFSYLDIANSLILCINFSCDHLLNPPCHLVFCDLLAFTCKSCMIVFGTDYRHTKVKSLILWGQNSNPNPK